MRGHERSPPWEVTSNRDLQGVRWRAVRLARGRMYEAEGTRDEMGMSPVCFRYRKESSGLGLKSENRG